MERAQIFLIRHGQTEWNASGRIQGALDSSLTPKGAAQAHEFGRRLAPFADQIDHVLFSPLGRARRTWEILRSQGGFPDGQADDRLRELSLGSWDGLTRVDIEACFPGRLDASTPFDWFFRSSDGESYEEAAARAGEWLADASGTTLAISHGVMSRVIRGVYLGLGPEDALRLPLRQGVILHLADGSVSEI